VLDALTIAEAFSVFALLSSRSLGRNNESDVPANRFVALYPKMRWAAAFQLVIVPFTSLEIMGVIGGFNDGGETIGNFLGQLTYAAISSHDGDKIFQIACGSEGPDTVMLTSTGEPSFCYVALLQTHNVQLAGGDFGG